MKPSPPDPPAFLSVPSSNCDARPGGAAAIDMLVLHYTGMRTAQDAIDRLRDPVAKVSSHYVVDEDGSIVQLVPEALRAFHAGISYWRGRRVLNDVSIGIEIVNPGHEWGYRPFPEAQMASVRRLCLGILARHAIPAIKIVGHSDIAPNRKQDPGELFDWRGLATAGIGLWPEAADAVLDTAIPDTPGVKSLLASIGYEIDPSSSDDDVSTALTAFQRHWVPETVTGKLDGLTGTRLASLAEIVAHQAS